MARETMCTRCDRIVYVSDNDDTQSCPVCSTPLIDAASGQLERKPKTAETATE